MARRAIVDRDTVLRLLREGKTSQAIANRYGVSRQAIDLYRKQFVIAGLLPGTHIARPSVTGNEPRPAIQYDYRQPAEPAAKPIPEPEVLPDPLPPRALETPALSLDEMVDLIIQAFTAMKSIPQLEAELKKVREDYESLLKQVEHLQQREQKRKEQETRWIHAQSPGIMTGQD